MAVRSLVFSAILLIIAGLIALFLMALGWLISHFGLGRAWAFGIAHPLYLLVTGMTLGLPVVVMLLVAAPVIAASWSRQLRIARDRRLAAERTSR